MSERVIKMVQAIENDAKNKVNEITDQTLQALRLEKNTIFQAGREKISIEYKKKMEELIIQQKIQKSAKINSIRLRKMTERHELIKELKNIVSKQYQNIVQDHNTYKNFLQKLIVQGLLKLVENQVLLICLKKDLDLVKQIIPQAQNQYQEIMKKECNQDVKCELNVSTTEFLDDINKNSIGGVLLSAFNGKIKCFNTIENRINLTFQEYLPLIKETCFPSMNN